MGVGIFFVVLLTIAAVIIGLVVAVPAVVAYLNARQENYKAKYLQERKNKNILYTAHREILSNQGDGAALISEIAVRDVDSNELKELN
jgi:biopolymer transport protein ExbB/TolQ